MNAYDMCHLPSHTCVPQVELENVVSQFEEADTKASMLSKQVTSLEGQLADAQDMLQEETRTKLALQTKLRAAEDHADNFQEQLEEEEEARRQLESRLSQLNIQVTF